MVRDADAHTGIRGFRAPGFMLFPSVTRHRATPASGAPALPPAGRSPRALDGSLTPGLSKMGTMLPRASKAVVRIYNVIVPSGSSARPAAAGAP